MGETIESTATTRAGRHPAWALALAVAVAVIGLAAMALLATSARGAQAQVELPPEFLDADRIDRIEAENFDSDASGSSYFDTDASLGDVFVESRDPAVAVDVFSRPNLASGDVIGRTRDGEFVEYTVMSPPLDVNDRFVVQLAVASGHPEPGSIRVDIDGTRVGVIDGGTDGWYDWQVRSTPAYNPEQSGPITVRLTWQDGGQVNLDWLAITKARQYDAAGFEVVDGLRVDLEPGVDFDDTDGSLGDVPIESSDPENAIDVFARPNLATGNIIGRTRTGEFVRYPIGVGQDGEYEIRLRVASGFETPGSIRVEVDDVLVGSVQGDTAGWYDWQTRSAGTVDLNGGDHDLRLTWENGGQVNLDWFQVVPVAGLAEGCAAGQIEAEAGVLNGRFEYVSDPDASGDFVVGVPKGSGGSWNGANGNYVEFCVRAPEAGDYSIQARLRTPSGQDNSFYVSVDDSPVVDFVATVSGDDYVIDTVNARAADDLLRPDDAPGKTIDPVQWTLDQGSQTVRFYLRRDGAQLDWIELVPAGQGEATPTPTPVTTWEQVGADIALGITKQASVAMSNNGSSLVVGGPTFDAAAVYDLVDGAWVQRGADIEDRADPTVRIGRRVAMSGDGNTVVVTREVIDELGVARDGSVQVYEWDGLAWVQVGENVVGEYGNPARSIAISDDGTTVVVGTEDAPVYDWDGASWVQRGEAPASAPFTLPDSVAISADGNVVVTGVGGSQLPIRISAWNGSAWTVRADSRFSLDNATPRYEVAINADGSSVIVGAPGDDSLGDVVVVDWNGTTYEERGELSSSDRRNFSQYGLGTAVAISDDGATVAIATAPWQETEEGDSIFPVDGNVGVLRWDGESWQSIGDRFGSRPREDVLTIGLSSDGTTVAIAGGTKYESDRPVIARTYTAAR